MRILAPFLMLALLLAPAASAGDIPLGQSFVIGVGEVVFVSGNHDVLIVGFDEILGDSRCPLDVLCFWEGEASAQLSLASASGEETVAALHTANSPFGDSSVEFVDHVIDLLDVSPYPESVEEAIDPNSYKIELVVEAVTVLPVPSSSWSVMKARFQ